MHRKLMSKSPELVYGPFRLCRAGITRCSASLVCNIIGMFFPSTSDPESQCGDDESVGCCLLRRFLVWFAYLGFAWANSLQWCKFGTPIRPAAKRVSSSVSAALAKKGASVKRAQKETQSILRQMRATRKHDDCKALI